MKLLKVKNFSQFQHYKDRNPPWIKLYTAITDDYLFSSLPDATKGHLMLIWLLASKTGNAIPHDARWVQQRIGASEKVRLDLLIQNGFLIPYENVSDCKQDASNVIADRKQDATDDSEYGLSDCKQDASPRALARGEQSRGETEKSRENPLVFPHAVSWPESFILTEDLRAYALRKHVLNPEEVFEHFENHHRAKGSRFKDWNRAWYTWVQNQYRFQGGKRVASTAGNGQRPKTFREIDEENQIRAGRRLLSLGLPESQRRKIMGEYFEEGVDSDSHHASVLDCGEEDADESGGRNALS